MPLGTEWVIDAGGCKPDALSDIEQLKAVFDRIIRDLKLNVIGEVSWHQFPVSGGVSGLALLSESHLACHTYPEFGAASFNLYHCSSRSSWPWERMLGEMLGASEVNIKVIERITHATNSKLEEIGQWAG